MITHTEAIPTNPSICPLCGSENNCLNIKDNKTRENCWCTNPTLDPSLDFSEVLLNSVPQAAKNKACICKACVQRFNNNRGVKNYQP